MSMTACEHCGLLMDTDYAPEVYRTGLRYVKLPNQKPKVAADPRGMFPACLCENCLHELDEKELYDGYY